MRKCKSCGRELQGSEVKYCPSCTSKSSHKIKKIVEVAAPLLIAVGGVAVKVLKKSKQ